MKKINKVKNYVDYNNEQYDEMKSLLDKSRKLFEQVEVDVELDREKEKITPVLFGPGAHQELRHLLQHAKLFVGCVCVCVCVNIANRKPRRRSRLWSEVLVKFSTPQGATAACMSTEELSRCRAFRRPRKSVKHLDVYLICFHFSSTSKLFSAK